MQTDGRRDLARQFLLPAFLMLLVSFRPGIAAEIRVVDQRGDPLQHAVVTANLVDRQDAGITMPVSVIAQQQQQFAPRVTVVRRGSEIRFPNRDTTLHHVYSFSKAKPFEIELYKGDTPDPILFDQAGIVALGCNIHDWMLGYIYVTGDDVFAVSREDGSAFLNAELHELREMTVWHPGSIDAAPHSLSPDEIDVTGNGEGRIVIATRALDPLQFEIDPLQKLFGTSLQ